MSSIWDANYIVTDVETTGHDPVNNRLTEIACVIVKDAYIENEYCSLINPHQFIPPFISKMTGITNEMAFMAPESKIVINQINDFLPKGNNIFVAHNVKFDYSFVYESFKRENLNFPVMPNLCTFKLAKKLLKADIKKNVGALAKYFGISMRARHRALDDAKATAQILIELIKIAEDEFGIKSYNELLVFQNKISTANKSKNKSFSRIENKLKQLSDSPGVYYYLDKNNNIIYVGKAKSLKKRVSSYFTNNNKHKSKIKDLINNIFDIKWTEVPTELQALLLESKEIKRLKPKYNRLDKEYKYYPLLKISNNDEYPKLQKSFTIKNDDAEYFGPFRSGLLVEEISNLIDRNFKLRKCEAPLKPHQDFRPCFFYHIKRCDAPCALLQTKDEYFREVNKVKNFLRGFSESIIEEYEDKMNQFANNLDFENAAIIRDDMLEIKKLFSRNENVSTSIENNNIILIMPNSEEDKTIDIYFFKFGLLIYQETIGRKAKLDNIVIKINKIYFHDNINKKEYSIEEINEVKIITAWLYRMQNIGKYIYLENKNIQNIYLELQSAIKNIIYFNNINNDEE